MNQESLDIARVVQLQRGGYIEGSFGVTGGDVAGAKDVWRIQV